MSELIRALIAILFIAPIGFFFAKKLAPKDTLISDFMNWRNLWLAVLIAAFLSHNFWVYIFLSSILILQFKTKVQNQMALYLILLFVIPPVNARIYAFGLVNYLVDMTHPRFIALIILLPASLAIAKKNNFNFNKVWTDKFILFYIILKLALELRDRTFTDALRQFFYVFPDIFLPYYVASRGIKSLMEMNTVLYAFTTSAIVISLISVLEILRHWLVYNPLVNVLSVGYEYGAYIGRDGSIRASASLAHPIVLGYFFTVALSFYFYFRDKITNEMNKKIGAIFILLGSIAALSRGPWVGAVAALLTFTFFGQNPLKKLSKLLLISLIVFPIILSSPYGEKIYNLIPFIGKTDDFNVSYRERLIDHAMIVINQYPLFGSHDWRATPEMQEMVQGEGIIDIVNSYILIGLNLGYTGIVIFALIFTSVIIAILKRLKKIKDRGNSLYVLGASLLSALVSILIMIASCSPILAVPIIYWIVLGLGVSYSRIVDDYLKSRTTRTSSNMV